MNMVKRIFLFGLTNILIVVTITTLLSFLGVRPYLYQHGLDIQSLAIYCLIWGFAGSFISLGLSRIMAKMMMGVKVIDPQTQDSNERWLIEKVHNLARMASLPKMPEVGIYNSPEVNAFATGPTKSRALVAVSSGLFQRMNQKEIEGVLGHEVTHIANGDMVTMTLLQGLVNAFVMFFARIIAFAVSQNVKEQSRYMVRFAVTILLEIMLSLLGMFVISYFSRHREFRADAGGAKLAGRDSMIAGLRKLQSMYELNDPKQNAVTAFKISTKRRGGLFALLSSHPPLEVRIQRLEQGSF